jgi:hypothetical protein
MLAINQYCDIAIGKVNKFDTKIAQPFPKQEREVLRLCRDFGA